MNILIIVACLIVGAILLAGLWNMMKGGSANKSQQLMRFRVIAQALAVLIIVIAVYMTQ